MKRAIGRILKAALALLATPALADTPASSTATSATAGSPAAGTVTLVNPLHVTTIPQLISNVLSTAMGMIGALALLIFIYGGFRWLTSGGEPAKIQAGKDAMKWAAIGLVIVFTSYALVSFVIKALTG